MTEVEWIQVKYRCGDDVQIVKFKAGKVGDPGVTAVVVDQALAREIREFAEPTDEGVLRSINQVSKADHVQEYCTIVDPGTGGDSGDCFCYMDHQRRWHCICDPV
ncbi:hypothetical protein ACFL0I_03675 [Gemmatimonadota bacterium]